MHQRLRAEITLPDGRVPVHCLASLHEGKESIAVFERGADGSIQEIGGGSKR